jgi:hypothetical protein
LRSGSDARAGSDVRSEVRSESDIKTGLDIKSGSPVRGASWVRKLDGVEDVENIVMNTVGKFDDYSGEKGREKGRDGLRSRDGDLNRSDINGSDSFNRDGSTRSSSPNDGEKVGVGSDFLVKMRETTEEKTGKKTGVVQTGSSAERPSVLRGQTEGQTGVQRGH